MSNYRDELSSGIACRLKELRESWAEEREQEKKLSHAALSEKLRQKYNILIHPDTLKFYEAGINTSKGYNNLGMKLETLFLLADFYGVSVDYIMGRDPYPLSDKARRNISNICTSPYRDILNDLLASPKLQMILDSIASSRLTIKKRIKEVMDTEDIDETRLAELKKESHHLMRDNAEDMEQALRYICKYNNLESAIKIKRVANRKKQEADNGEHTED